MGPSNNFWKWSWKKIFVWEVKCTAAQHARSPKNVKKPQTTNLMWLSLIWAILVLFVCWNLFYTLANLRIKCVTETKNVSLLFYKNLKSNFSTLLRGFFTFLVALVNGVPCGVRRVVMCLEMLVITCSLITTLRRNVSWNDRFDFSSCAKCFMWCNSTFFDAPWCVLKCLRSRRFSNCAECF